MFMSFGIGRHLFSLRGIVFKQTQSGESQSNGPDLPLHEISSVEEAPTLDEDPGLKTNYDDHMGRPGLGGLCSLQRQDRLYAMFPRLTEAFMYCIWNEAAYLVGQYDQILEADEAGLEDLEGQRRAFTDKVMRYGNLVKTCKTIQSSAQPNQNLLGKLIEYARRKLGDENALGLDRFPDDWGIFAPPQQLESWAKLLPESRIGKFLMSGFVRDKQKTGMAVSRSYGEDVLRRLLVTILLFLIAIFCAIPMILLALDFMNSTQMVITAAAWLFGFSLIAPSLVRNEETLLLLIMGYAGFLCAMMKDKVELTMTG